MCEATGYDIIVGPTSSKTFGGLITCTCPQRCPVLFPVSRNHRPPGHGSSFMFISFIGPCGSSSVSNTMSAGAAMKVSLTTFNVLISVSPAIAFLLRFGFIPRRGATRFRIAPGFACRALPGFLFRNLLDTVEMIGPEFLERPNPVMHRLEFLRVQRIQPPLPGLGNRNQPHLPKHPQMLGN